MIPVAYLRSDRIEARTIAFGNVKKSCLNGKLDTDIDTSSNSLRQHGCQDSRRRDPNQMKRAKKASKKKHCIDTQDSSSNVN